jgi:hypothetical protein
MSFNFGAFAGGIGAGAKSAVDLLTSLDEAQDRKEDRKFLREEQAEKRRIRQAQVDYATQLENLRKERQSGTGSFEQYVNDGIRQARSVQGVASPASDTSNAYGSRNPLMDGGEGLYGNQSVADNHYYDRLGQIQERLYSVTDPTKVTMVREEIDALRERGYDRQRKLAASALISGAPNAIRLANQAYGFQRDGFALDDKSGTFDPQKGWTGINLVDKNGQVSRTMDLTTEDIAKLYLAGDPARLVEFNLKNRGVIAQEKSADASVVSANASATSAGAAVTRANADAAQVPSQNRLRDAQADYYGGAAAGIRQSQADARIESMFAPFAKEQVIDPNLPTDRQAIIRQSNTNLAIQKGLATELYRNPVNANNRNPGTLWAASGELLDLRPDRNAQGALSIDPVKYFKPTDNPNFVLYVSPTNPSVRVVIPKEAATQLMQQAGQRQPR